MFESPSAFIQTPQERQKPWKCLECKQRFKWDVQLLRHERKTGHFNQDREIRRERRYKRAQAKVIRCSFCSLCLEDPRKRLEHARWCEGDKRTLKTRELYQSSYDKFPYECSLHSEPHYFSSLQGLQEHIKSHRKFDKQKIEAIRSVFVWRKKWNWAGLTNQQYQQLARKYGIQISFSTMRRIFQKS